MSCCRAPKPGKVSHDPALSKRSSRGQRACPTATVAGPLFSFGAAAFHPSLIQAATDNSWCREDAYAEVARDTLAKMQSGL
jgi:hypothetical protein